MVIRSLRSRTLSGLLTGALFAEAVRLDPPQQRRSRRSSRRIVNRAQNSSLSDWFPRIDLNQRSQLFCAGRL